MRTAYITVQNGCVLIAMLFLLVLFTFINFLLYEIWKRKKIFQLREELGLSGPKIDYIFGNFRHILGIIRKEGLSATTSVYPNLLKLYGNTFGFYFGTNLEIVTTDTAIINEVFVTKFKHFVARKTVPITTVYPMVDGLIGVDHKGTYGVGWKDMRTVVSSIFTTGKMRKMHVLFNDKLGTLMDVIGEKTCENDGIMDIYAEYQAMTMDMIARCALGQETSCIRDRQNEYYLRARQFIQNVSYSKSFIFGYSMFFPFLKYFRRFSNFGKQERWLVDRLSEMFHQRAKERAESKIRPLPDLIDLLLAENEQRVESGTTPFHHEILVSNAWAFFVAGYETTSTALAFASYLLAKNPEAQETLYEEIIGTFGDGPMNYDTLMKLPYLHAVFSETLRVYPPVISFTARCCIEETVIGGRYRVPAGVSVVAPIHAIMWDEQYYDRPLDFIPERFLNEKKPAWSATYLPFGIGPRNCVGARFAEMEFKTVLSEVTRRFITQLDPNRPELVTMTANILHYPIDGKVHVRLLKREQ